MQQEQLISQLFKTEYSKIVAVLCKLFGIEHIEIAEDLTSETFLLASKTWDNQNIPAQPAAWLYTVAKNKTKDYFRRNSLFREKIAVGYAKNAALAEEIEIDLSVKNITDSQLQMIFTICNPVIPAEAQIGLALRVLCGFSIDEIAEAFLTKKETINKRLFRAKEKLRTENIKIEFPHKNEINDRLEMVLTTLYLLFNEGYHSSTQKSHIRKELCLEAMRLNYFLIENESTSLPTVKALMALMCFHSSRFDARISAKGEAILLEEQDKNLWDEDLIQKGNFFLIESSKGNEISKFHIEASIAYWHCTKIENANKWENILQLYNRLLQIEYSPIAALNRTYALSKVFGNSKAIQEALKLNLEENHYYHTLLASFYVESEKPKAIYHFEIAYQLARSVNDKLTIENHLKKLK